MVRIEIKKVANGQMMLGIRPERLISKSTKIF